MLELVVQVLFFFQPGLLPPDIFCYDHPVGLRPGGGEGAEPRQGEGDEGPEGLQGPPEAVGDGEGHEGEVPGARAAEAGGARGGQGSPASLLFMLFHTGCDKFLQGTGIIINLHVNVHTFSAH